MSTSTSEASPVAPGRLGEAIPAAALLGYLTGLGRWVDGRRRELDWLDAAALASADSDSYTADIVLAESLWQACRVRRGELEVVWDSGRADVMARERMSQLIWGRLTLSAAAGASGAGFVSLVEAVRLLDALVAQLRTRLSFDPNGSGVASRLSAIRAGVERARDLAVRERDSRAALDRVDTLRRRVDDLAAKAARGADVTGPLGQLDHDAALLERDLIVASATRRELVLDSSAAGRSLAALAREEPRLRALAERCRREIANPPRFAVPDVSRLGEPPSDRSGLDGYLARLDAVARAFDAIEEAYSEPLRLRAELRYRLTGAEAKARSGGRTLVSSPGAATVASAAEDARSAVEATPCDLVLARFLIENYEAVARPFPGTPGSGSSDTRQEGRRP